MCDALSWNTYPLPEGVERLLANCMSHGRRQFVEVAENFPGECRYVLKTLGGIWRHDALAQPQGYDQLLGLFDSAITFRARFQRRLERPALLALGAVLGGKARREERKPSNTPTNPPTAPRRPSGLGL